MSADRFDDADDDEDYFAEVDDGDDTGKGPRFVKVPELDVTPVELSETRVNELFAMYIALRNQLSTDRKGWKAREAKMKSQMLTIGGILLNKSKELGVQSLSGTAGSGYSQIRTKFKVASDGWEAFTQWLWETKNFHVVQKRVSPDAVREVMGATGEIPPGLESLQEETFVVRSPSVRKSKV